MKLKRVGLLTPGQENNVDAVAQAKKQFLEKYGFTVEQRVYRNDTNELLPKSANREDLSAYV